MKRQDKIGQFLLQGEHGDLSRGDLLRERFRLAE